jgi:hypothetical protein
MPDIIDTDVIRFTRAKRVRVEAKLNEVVDDKTQLRVYRMEIEQLKARSPIVISL